VTSTSYTAILADFIAGAKARSLPADVIEKTQHHVLDTLAACVSGARLPAGERALAFVAPLAAPHGARVLGSALRVRPDDAALANGMTAHADETDDSHAASITHPGCAVVPAALAACEHFGAGGATFVAAVALGYDLCARIAAALGGEDFFAAHHSSHAYGGIFGAAAAAAVPAGLDARAARALLSYAAQQASGLTCWRRDPDHIEKAFDFGGMPARNGLGAALMVAAGFTGVPDALDGAPGFFAAWPGATPERSIDALGERYEIVETTIKRWCVGSPIQAPLDAVETLLASERFGAADVEAIDVDLAVEAARVVDGRPMANVNLQHQVALLIVDGTLTFESSHAADRMRDPAVAPLAARIRIVPSPDLSAVQPSRQARVAVRLRDGRELRYHARDVKGTPALPMTRAEVAAKAQDLMAPVLGAERAATAIAATFALEQQRDVRAFAELFAVRA
jgi:2-methylcitrate dehydratase PrpD